MPRRAKTQPAEAPAGQGYGERQDQMQAQEAMPLPDTRATPPGGGPAPSPAPGGAASPAEGGAAPGGDPMAAALGAAQSMEAPTPPPWAEAPLDEPMTNGLPMGPGPGPEAIGMAPRRINTAQVLQQMAATTGNPYFAELAQEAAAADERPV